MKKFLSLFIFFFVLAMGFAVVGGANAAAVSKDEAFKAIVKIKSFTLDADNDLSLYSSGSGIIINSSGIVLTNQHVVIYEDDFDNTERESSYIICLTEDASKEPDCSYTGQLIASDKDIDVAILKINNIAGYSAKSVFPYLDLNTSDATLTGDKVTALGYPAIGGDTITTTQGSISGKESKYNKSWIKTDAVISYGNSGGAAIDANGKVIGITTAGHSDLLGSLGYIINITSINDWINSNKVKSAQTSSLVSRTENIAKKVIDYKNGGNTFMALNAPIFSITKPSDWEFTFVDEDALRIDKGSDDDGGEIYISHDAKFPYAVSTDMIEGISKREVGAIFLDALATIKIEDVAINGKKGQRHTISVGAEQAGSGYRFPAGNYVLDIGYDYGENDKDKSTVDAIINSLLINDLGAQLGEISSYTNQNPKFSINLSGDWALLARNSKERPVFIANKSNKLVFADINVLRNTPILSNEEYLSSLEQGIITSNSLLLSRKDIKQELTSKNAHFKLNDNLQDIVMIDVARKSISSGKTFSQGRSYFIVSGDKNIIISLNYFSDNIATYNNVVNEFNGMLASLVVDSVATSTSATTPTTPTTTSTATSVVTNGTTSITSNSAKLNSTINPKGYSTSAQFEYGTNSSALSNSTYSQDVGSSDQYITVSDTVSGLSPGTYYFRVVAKNSSGTIYGETRSFTIEGGTVGQSQATPSSGFYQSRAGALLKAQNNPDVYVVNQDGQRIKIHSPEEFNQKGYKWDQIQEVTSDELASIPTMTSGSAPSASQESSYPNGTLIKSADSPDVYVIVNGQKRKIPDPATFNNWGYKWDQIKEAPASDVNKFSNIDISSDIVRAKDDTKIYRIIGDKKIWIPSVQAFLGSGYKPNSEIEIEPADLANFEDVKYIKAKGGTYVYEIKGNKKYRVTNTAGISDQEIKTVTVAEFTAYPIGQ